MQTELLEKYVSLIIINNSYNDDDNLYNSYNSYNPYVSIMDITLIPLITALKQKIVTYNAL